MQPRNVTHIIPTLDIGGAEMVLARLIAVLDRSVWRAGVVSLRDKGPLAPDLVTSGADVVALEMRGSLPGPGAIRRLRGAVQTLAPDLLQGWMYHGGLAALAARSFGSDKTPVVWTIRSDVFGFSSEKRLTAWVVRLCRVLSSRVEQIVYNSRSSAEGHARLGFATKRAIVIPNGFDTRTFEPSATAHRTLRSRLGMANDSVIIGRIGRYHPVKDFPGFLDAAALVVARRPTVRFVLAGPGVSADNQGLMHEIQRRGLTREVHVLGEVRPVQGLVAGLDIMCSSSAYGESFPNVLGEAMACGVPCVATDLGDSAWIVGGEGRVVPPRDPAAMAAACEALVDLGRDGRARLGAAGRARMVSEFSINRMVTQYADLYADLVHRAPVMRRATSPAG